jgi:acyl carrier protein
MKTTASTLDEVKSLIGKILGIADRLDSMDASTRLLGSLPELDSLAVAELLTAIEDRFSFEMDYADLTTDMLETVGTLVAYVKKKSALNSP